MAYGSKGIKKYLNKDNIPQYAIGVMIAIVLMAHDKTEGAIGNIVATVKSTLFKGQVR